MKILVGYESSGAVRRELRRLLYDAYSCDLLPAEDGSPHHLQCDVWDALKTQRWDAFIGFPTCTYVCGSGIHWNKGDEVRSAKTDYWVNNFARLLALPIDRIALENPVGVLSTRVRKPDQIIQPYRFGEDASKTTCLWLKSLRPLRELPMDQWAKPRWVCRQCKRVSTDEQAQKWRGPSGHCLCHHCDTTPRLLPRWSNQTDSGQNRLAPSADRWRERSRTYAGIARAMAEQWFPCDLI